MYRLRGPLLDRTSLKQYRIELGVPIAVLTKNRDGQYDFTGKNGSHPCTLSLFLTFSERVQSGGNPPGTGFSGVGDPSGFSDASPPPVPGSSISGDGGGNHFPITSYMTFEAGSLDKVEGKIKELNTSVPDDQKVGTAGV